MSREVDPARALSVVGLSFIAIGAASLLLTLSTAVTLAPTNHLARIYSAIVLGLGILLWKKGQQ